MGIMITYHGYNNGHNNPMYNVHKNAGAHYTQEHIIHSKIQYLGRQNILQLYLVEGLVLEVIRQQL